jgi:hypothetical protein
MLPGVLRMDGFMKRKVGLPVKTTRLMGWVSAVAVFAALVPVVAGAQNSGTSGNTIGQVEYVRGVGLAQAPGQPPRVLGKGLALAEGDRLTTADGATAIVALQDGTRMTVRPNSEMLVQQYRYSQGASDNNMLLSLVRGGLRTLTGLMTKNAPSAAKIQTATATVGIRGTDFDIRVCAADCAAESAKVQDSGRPNAIQASAKVVMHEGSLSATDASGQQRVLVNGGAVYPGDLVETGSAARAVLAFRDESRITLGAASRFRVDNFVFDAGNAKEGRFLVSLLRGSLRALTGLVSKANHRNVLFTTPTATVGIRGTGLDLDCADNGCAAFTWLGTIEVTPDPQVVQNQVPSQLVVAGQGLFVGPAGVTPLNASPLNHLPRPDQVPVDNKSLFEGNNASESLPGLYVFVRNGHIELISAIETLQLGRGETGYVGPEGITGRPGIIPRFIDFDATPLPRSRNTALIEVLDDLKLRTVNQCR